VDDLPDNYLSKSIRDLDLRKKTGCTVIGYKAIDTEYVINPEAEIRLLKGSKLIVLGRPEQVAILQAIC
jgi:voltage-gated potassium channel